MTKQLQIIGWTVLLMCSSMLFAACGLKQHSPRSVAEAAMKSLQNEDVDAFCKLLYFAPDEPTELRNFHTAMVKSMMSEKILPLFRKNGGIKNCDIVGERISENINIARVNVKVVYANNEEETFCICTQKDEKGKWWIENLY